MNLKKVSIDEVISWDKNPRNITKKDFERLKKQITELGMYKPLLAVRENGKYIILGGNMRLEALKALGISEVDLTVVQAKTERDKIKYALSDNDRVGAYDEQALAELIFPHIEEISLEDYKVDLGEPWTDLKLVIERFGPDIDPEAEWQGMPEFDQENQKGFKIILVHFPNQKSVDVFAKLVDQTITEKTKFIWFPKAKKSSTKDAIYLDES